MQKLVLNVSKASTTNIIRHSRPVKNALQTFGRRREVTEALQKTDIFFGEFGHWMPVISQLAA
jgi:hypothetical protein